MGNLPIANIVKYFAELLDPRTGNAKVHIFLEVLIIAICRCSTSTKRYFLYVTMIRLMLRRLAADLLFIHFLKMILFLGRAATVS